MAIPPIPPKPSLWKKESGKVLLKNPLDIDFQGLKAIAMAADNGTSFPSNPSTAQWFYRTDLKTLFIYEGIWQSHVSFGEITLYATPGGTGSGFSESDKANFADVLAAIPPSYGGDVVILADAGDYTSEGTLSVTGKTPSGNFKIHIVGTIDSKTEVTLTNDYHYDNAGGVRDHDTDGCYVIVDETLIPSDHKNMICELQTGDGAASNTVQGGRFLVEDNTADRLFIAGTPDTISTVYSGARVNPSFPNTGDTAYIFDCATIVAGFKILSPFVEIKKIKTTTTNNFNASEAVFEANQHISNNTNSIATDSNLRLYGCFINGPRLINQQSTDLFRMRSCLLEDTNSGDGTTTIRAFNMQTQNCIYRQERADQYATGKDGLRPEDLGKAGGDFRDYHIPGVTARIYGYGATGFKARRMALGTFPNSFWYFGRPTVTGTTDGTTLNQLDDSGTDFTAEDVKIGDFVALWDTSGTTEVATSNLHIKDTGVFTNVAVRDMIKLTDSTPNQYATIIEIVSNDEVKVNWKLNTSNSAGLAFEVLRISNGAKVTGINNGWLDLDSDAGDTGFDYEVRPTNDTNFDADATSNMIS